MKNSFLNKNKRGFTLIETLIALTILVIGVTSAFTAASQGISGAILSKDQVIAFYLAQEGMEMVRNTRDENGLKSLNWLHGLSEFPSDPCYFSDINGPGNSCYRDLTTTSFTACTGVGQCPVMRRNVTAGNSAYGFYTYNALSPVTAFTREIHLSSINAHEVAVTVTVSWAKGAVSRSFVARENLFDWQTP